MCINTELVRHSGTGGGGRAQRSGSCHLTERVGERETEWEKRERCQLNQTCGPLGHEFSPLPYRRLQSKFVINNTCVTQWVTVNTYCLIVIANHDSCFRSKNTFVDNEETIIWPQVINCWILRLTMNGCSSEEQWKENRSLRVNSSSSRWPCQVTPQILLEW